MRTSGLASNVIWLWTRGVGVFVVDEGREESEAVADY